MTQHKNVLRYCMAMMAIALTLISAITGFNALVDPFGMYRQIKIEGFNANKPAIYSRMRLYKAFEVEHVKPQTVILGSSRTHVGLRCSHKALAALDGPCYNLAFDGATTKEMYEYLRHAQAIKPLKHVILGLDSYHSAPAPAFMRPDFDPLLLYTSNRPHWIRSITADLRILASLDTLRASIQTLRTQQHSEPNWFAPDGQRLGEVFFRQVEPTFVKDGPRAYMEAIDRQELQGQTSAAPVKRHFETLSNPQESSLSYIRRIIEFCRAQHIDLRIFITPAHAHQLEIAAILWGEASLETDKRALVQLLAEDTTRHPDQPPIRLMDFSGYSSVTTEPLPPTGSRTEMRYYWDSSHFKEIAGDYVMDRLFDISQEHVPSDFGIHLTPQTLETVLTNQREARTAYRMQFAKDVSALRALKSGLPILVYHQLLPLLDKSADASTAISVTDFESQMSYLHEQGYTTLSMDEVVQYLKGEAFPQRIVAIHFDDGWKSAMKALPILDRYGFKATFWIIAGAGHDTGSPHMDWDEILALASNPNIDIFSHTMTHPWRDGDTLIDWVEGHTPGKGLQQACWELTESKRLLKEKLGRTIPYLAWPRGLYNDALISAAKKAGYQALLTIDDGINHPGDDLLHIHRTMVNGACDRTAFQQILSDGIYRNCASQDKRVRKGG